MRVDREHLEDKDKMEEVKKKRIKLENMGINGLKLTVKHTAPSTAVAMTTTGTSNMSLQKRT